jgi:hypothetical protein
LRRLAPHAEAPSIVEGVAGQEGLEPPTTGFGDRDSTN